MNGRAEARTGSKSFIPSVVIETSTITMTGLSWAPAPPAGKDRAPLKSKLPSQSCSLIGKEKQRFINKTELPRSTEPAS